jgi:hypothetical protein
VSRVKNKSIIIVGMHRSGTSAASGELSRLGVFMGKDLLKAKEGINEKGYGENVKIIELNEEIFDGMHSSWDDPMGLIKQKSLIKLSESFVHKAEALFIEEYQHKKLWGMKDPRVSILLPFWKKALNNIGCEVNYLFIIRHPNEVVKSLVKRNGFSEKKGLILWLNYNLSIYLHTTSQNRIIFNFDDVISSPADVEQRLKEYFNLEFPSTEKEFFIERSLKNQESNPNTKESTNFLEHTATTLFDAILSDNSTKIKEINRVYTEYMQGLDSVLIEHLEALKKIEVDNRMSTKKITDSKAWKLVKPIQAAYSFLRKTPKST